MLSEEAARLLLLIRSRPADTSSQLPQSAALQQEFVNLTSRVNALNSKVLSQGVDVEANSEKLDETFLLAREANNLGGQNRSETSALQHNLGVRISALEAEGRARSVTGEHFSRTLSCSANASADKMLRLQGQAALAQIGAKTVAAKKLKVHSFHCTLGTQCSR